MALYLVLWACLLFLWLCSEPGTKAARWLGMTLLVLMGWGALTWLA